jgi:2'-5' RNA ligase
MDPVPVSQILSAQRPVNVQMRVDQVILYQSATGAAHSRYSVVTAFPLE